MGSAFKRVRARRFAALWIGLGLVAAACGPTVHAPTGATTGALGGTEAAGSGLDMPGATSGKLGKSGGSALGGIGGSGEMGSSANGTVAGGTAAGGAPTVNGSQVVSSKEPIKVAFILVNQDEANKMAGSAGVSFLDQGDGEQQVKAVVDYVNAHGGVAGHRMVPVITYRDPSEDTSAEEARCRHLTEDEHVFAVVGNGSTAADCMAKHATLVLGDQAFDKTTLVKDAPYIWDPGLPYAEAGYAALVKSLAQQGFFKGDVKLGIGAWDDPGTHNAFDNVVKPMLSHVYKGKFDIQYVDANSDDWSSRSQQMAVRFKGEGINRVFFLAPGAGVPLFFMQAARAQAYYPQYGLSTYDNPILLMTAHQTDELRGSIGTGWDTAIDIDDAHSGPYPAGPAETRCETALRREHAQRPSRAAAIYAGYICDGAFMLQDAAALVQGPLTTASWAAAADRLQDRFQSTWTFPGTTYFRPGRRAGSVTYRDLAYSVNCQCFLYTSGPKQDPM